MIKILDIHKKHKKENEKVANETNDVQEQGEPVSDDEVDEAQSHASPDNIDFDEMQEQDLDRKLQAFKGKKD